MPDDLFYDLPCGASAYAIPAYYSVANTYVPDPPPPIFDCLQSLPPAPAPEAPCPVLGPGEVVSYTPFGEPDTAVTTRLTITKTNCCEFVFDLTVAVPCITFGPDSQTYVAPFTDGPATLTTKIANVTRDVSEVYGVADNCAFELTQELVVHCPTIEPAYTYRPLPFVDSNVGELRVTVYRDDANCDFVIDVEGEAPCPTITGSGATIPFTSGATSIAIAVDKNENCEFELTPSGFDHCPTFTSKLTVTPGGIGGTPSGSFGVTGDASCNFEAALALTIPESCEPVVNGTDGDVTILPTGKTGYVDVNVSQTDACTFDISVSVAIPKGAGAGGGGGAGGGFGPGSGSGSGAPCIGVRPEDFFKCVNGKTTLRQGTLCINGDGLYFVDDVVDPGVPTID